MKVNLSELKMVVTGGILPYDDLGYVLRLKYEGDSDEESYPAEFAWAVGDRSYVMIRGFLYELPCLLLNESIIEVCGERDNVAARTLVDSILGNPDALDDDREWALIWDEVLTTGRLPG